MHDSYTPLGGLVPLFNMQTGEVIFGGVGAGLYGILLYAILAVFIAGLMVGRTPEYLGKKIEQKEVKMAMLALIATAVQHPRLHRRSLGRRRSPRTATGIRSGRPIANLNNAGPHGFAEILYAYTSATGNNGSAFAGISANTPWYNLTLGLGDADRPLPVPAAAARRGRQPGREEARAGDQRHAADHGGLFVGLLVGTVVIVGALTFFPALSLGPIVEHFLMHQGQLFSLAMPALMGMPWL